MLWLWTGLARASLLRQLEALLEQVIAPSQDQNITLSLGHTLELAALCEAKLPQSLQLSHLISRGLLQVNSPALLPPCPRTVHYSDFIALFEHGRHALPCGGLLATPFSIELPALTPSLLTLLYQMGYKVVVSNSSADHFTLQNQTDMLIANGTGGLCRNCKTINQRLIENLPGRTRPFQYKRVQNVTLYTDVQFLKAVIRKLSSAYNKLAANPFELSEFTPELRGMEQLRAQVNVVSSVKPDIGGISRKLRLYASKLEVMLDYVLDNVIHTDQDISTLATYQACSSLLPCDLVLVGEDLAVKVFNSGGRKQNAVLRFGSPGYPPFAVRGARAEVLCQGTAKKLYCQTFVFMSLYTYALVQFQRANSNVFQEKEAQLFEDRNLGVSALGDSLSLRSSKVQVSLKLKSLGEYFRFMGKLKVTQANKLTKVRVLITESSWVTILHDSEANQTDLEFVGLGSQEVSLVVQLEQPIEKATYDVNGFMLHQATAVNSQPVSLLHAQLKQSTFGLLFDKTRTVTVTHESIIVGLSRNSGYVSISKSKVQHISLFFNATIDRLRQAQIELQQPILISQRSHPTHPITSKFKPQLAQLESLENATNLGRLNFKVAKYQSGWLLSVQNLLSTAVESTILSSEREVLPFKQFYGWGGFVFKSFKQVGVAGLITIQELNRNLQYPTEISTNALKYNFTGRLKLKPYEIRTFRLAQQMPSQECKPGTEPLVKVIQYPVQVQQRVVNRKSESVLDNLFWRQVRDRVAKLQELLR